MRRALILLRAASLGFQFSGGFGFVEIRWGGLQVKLGGHLVDPFFIEAASIFLIAFGTFSLIGLCWNLIAKWRWVESLLTSARPDEERAKEKAIQELASQIRAARDRFVAAKSGFEFGERRINRYEINAEMADISIKLKRIGLSVPESVEGGNIVAVIDRWRAYLSILLPLSEMGDFVRAKAISFSGNRVQLDL